MPHKCEEEPYEQLLPEQRVRDGSAWRPQLHPHGAAWRLPLLLTDGRLGPCTGQAKNGRIPSTS